MAHNYIRNICILAHIDHGKTSIADCLLSRSGIINRRSAGVVRYLDDRSDEQSRGITMKSSAISLNYRINDPYDNTKESYLILNLVDTPGHIDFSIEVNAALRLCDGALIVVDAVEGLRTQTKECMKKCYEEKLPMVLIINKIDRLITTLEQDGKEMYRVISATINACNEYMRSLYVSSLMEFPNELGCYMNDNNTSSNDEDENRKYFDPCKLNVIFASALDGWGFTLREIATMYLGLIKDETVESLIDHLWDPDSYIKLPEKRIQKGAVKKNKANVFVQLALSPVYCVYFQIIMNPDKAVLPVLFQKLCIRDDGIKNEAIKSFSRKRQKETAKLMLEAWNPLSDVILKQFICCVPSPFNLSEERIVRLFSSDAYVKSSLVSTMNSVKSCDVNGLTMAYISKVVFLDQSNANHSNCQIVYPKARGSTQNGFDEAESFEKLSLIDATEATVIGFCRVFSGKIFIGQKLYLFDSKYELDEYTVTQEKEKYDTIKEVVVTGVFELSTRQNYKNVDHMDAGYTCGITAKENNLQVGTLSSYLNILPFKEQLTLEPIICVVITPIVPSESTQLQESLRLLKQCDPSVRVVLSSAGEYLLFTAGDVHLDKSLTDLKTKFKCPAFSISPPTYSLRETVDNNGDIDIMEYDIVVDDCKISLGIGVTAMPKKLVKVIEEYNTLLKSIQKNYVMPAINTPDQCENKELEKSISDMFTNKLITNAIEVLKHRINEILYKADEFFKNLKQMNIWRVTVNRHNINLLLNCIPDCTYNIFSTSHSDTSDEHMWLYTQIKHAFSMFCNAGPLCEEPLNETVFIINKLTISGDVTTLYHGNTQHLLSQRIKAGLRAAFFQRGPLIMEPILSTNVTAGFLYGSNIYIEVRRRFGKIVAEFDFDEDNKTYVAKAFIPATESQGFANAIRKISAGAANPDLNFSHYEVAAGASLDDLSDEDEIPNPTRAERLITNIRIRKGLSTTSQVVTHAEKQRTLKK